MTKKICTVVTMIVLGAFAAAAQQTPPAGGAAGQGRGGRQGGRAGGPASVPSIPKRPTASPTGSELGLIRVAAQDDKIWFGWRVAMPTNAIKGMTFSDVVAKAGAMSVPAVEVSSTQQVAFEIPKPFDYRLQTGERNAVNYRLRELGEQVAIYRVPNFPADEATRRKVLEFARGLIGTPIVVVPADTASSAADLDKLATEYGVDVAIDSRTDPKALMTTLSGTSKHVGAAADLGGWMQNGVAPVDGLKAVSDKLLVVEASDRSALGAKGTTVPLGSGSAALGAFFVAASHGASKPLNIDIESTGTTEADMLKNLDAFERVMLPAMAERVRVMLASPAGQIRGGDRLTGEQRAKIDAAAPHKAVVTPKRPRKMLVTDIQMYSGHSTIPHGNYLLELMGKYTGAFTPTFSNDPELLKYPKIKEFDAVYLNNVCGMVYNDPEVRADLLRYVREGGGLGGHHAVTFANNNWAEFTDMMGGWAGAHHTEKQVIKVDDPNSPLTRSFGSASFEHTDEFYQMPMYAPYSREKQHVLLSIDVEKSDRATNNRPCTECTRTDQDYGLAWIKEYGKGRTYFTPLGHTDAFYEDPRWTNHLLAAIQYILGDLDADATPSAKLAKK
jgi:type 1 glutamine amidotransferase/sugar phosphate isomerase/epimerase